MSVTKDLRARPAGDFDAFFRAEYPRLVKLAWLLTHSASAAEEIAQDALSGVHGRFAALDTPAAYATTAVVNGCRGWHRKAALRRRVERTLAAGSSVPAETSDEYLLDALHRLPYRQRVVIVARYWGGWSEAEIAAALGCRPGTVKSLASRALARLRTEIDR